MCRLCQHWRPVSLRWGDCLCPAMRFDFVPYTQGPFGVPLAAFNEAQRPHPVPLTEPEYDCEHFAARSHATGRAGEPVGA